MEKPVEKLKKLRDEAIAAEKLVCVAKIKEAYEETRANSQKVFDICMKELFKEAANPYRQEISCQFDCNSAMHHSIKYFYDHLYFLPNKSEIAAFGYCYGKKSKEPAIFFDINYFQEIVNSNNGLSFKLNKLDNSSYYAFVLSLDEKLKTVDEYIRSQKL